MAIVADIETVQSQLAKPHRVPGFFARRGHRCRPQLR